MKLFVLIALLSTTLCVALCAGCGGGNSTPSMDSAGLSPQQIISGLDTLEMPPGVDPQTWDSVVSAFIEAVNNPPKQASEPGDGLRVAELAVDIQPDASANLSWLYANNGDYDINGEVNIADIAPVAIFFLANTLSPNWTEAQVADGDGNGEVNLADITPIAVNYKQVVAGYQVQESVSAEGAAWDNFAYVPFDDGAVLDGSPLPAFQPHLEDLQNTNYYRVVPTSDTDGTLHENAQSPASRYLANVWAMEGGNAQMQYSSPLSGPDGLALHWSLQLESLYTDFQPVVGPDGTVYVVSQLGEITAVSPQGEIKWALTFGSVTAAPVVTPDGRLLVGGSDGVTTISPTGEVIDQDWLEFDYPRQVLVDSEGKIYLRSNDYVAVYSPEGEMLWEYSGEHSPDKMIVSEGSVYCIFGYGYILKAFNEDGSVRWESLLEFGLSFGISISQDGDVLLNAYMLGMWSPDNVHPTVRALNPVDGTMLWSYENTLNYHGMAVCPDGTIRLEALSGEIASLDSSGNPLWINDAIMGEMLFYPDEMFDRHCVDVDGKLFVMAHGIDGGTHQQKNDLYSVSEGGARNWTHNLSIQDNSFASTPVIGLNQTVYFYDTDSTLYAFGLDGMFTPPPPTDVTASRSAYPDRIVIHWDPSPGAESYRVYREDHDFSVGTTSDTTWTDSSVEITPSMYYVTALNEVGESQASESAEGTFYLVAGDSRPGVWSMPNCNASNTNQAGVPGPNMANAFSNFSQETYQINSIVFGSQGMMYLCAWHKVIAVKDGEQVWEFDCLDRNPSSLAVGDDGQLYFFMDYPNYSVNKTELYCLSNNRVFLWKQPVSGIHSDLVVGADGTVYYTDGLDTLTAVNPSGVVKWKFKSGNQNRMVVAPSVALNGTVYIKGGYISGTSRVASQGGPRGPDEPYLRTAYAVNPDGSLKWTYPTEELDYYPIVVSPGGTVYVTFKSRQILALNPDGSLLWESDLPFHNYPKPVVGHLGQLYIQGRESADDLTSIMSLDPADGSLLWQYPFADYTGGTHIVDSRGIIYVIGTESKDIQAIDEQGQEIWNYSLDSIESSRLREILTFGNNGDLYFADNSGYLYWLGED